MRLSIQRRLGFVLHPVCAAAEKVSSLIRNFKGIKFNRLKNLFPQIADFLRFTWHLKKVPLLNVIF